MRGYYSCTPQRMEMLRACLSLQTTEHWSHWAKEADATVCREKSWGCGEQKTAKGLNIKHSGCLLNPHFTRVHEACTSGQCRAVCFCRQGHSSSAMQTDTTRNGTLGPDEKQLCLCLDLCCLAWRQACFAHKGFRELFFPYVWPWGMQDTVLIFFVHLLMFSILIVSSKRYFAY